MLIASTNKDEIRLLKLQLNEKFEMKDLCDANKILDMKIHRDRRRGIIFLCQKIYLKKVLHHFGLNEHLKLVSTPFSFPFIIISLSPTIDEKQKYMLQVSYSNAIGSLMYVMVCTRPNISMTLVL